MNVSRIEKIIVLSALAGFSGCSPAELAFTSQSGTLNQAEPPPVCAPFDPTHPGTDQYGLSGHIRYLNSGTPRPASVSDVLSWGNDAGVKLSMNSLNAPTVRFTRGFINPMTNEALRIPGSNTILIEWFAFDLYSELMLSDSQPEGFYQLALLSDDGAILDIDATKSSPGQIAVNNDGEHPTRMGCSAKAFYFRKNESRPIRIRYYQGPRDHIALQLLWRKVSSENAARDGSCGLTGNDTFWNSNVTPSVPTPKYNEIMCHGWSVPSPENFILPGDAGSNPCANGI